MTQTGKERDVKGATTPGAGTKPITNFFKRVAPPSVDGTAKKSRQASDFLARTPLSEAPAQRPQHVVDLTADGFKPIPMLLPRNDKPPAVRAAPAASVSRSVPASLGGAFPTSSVSHVSATQPESSFQPSSYRTGVVAQPQQSHGNSLGTIASRTQASQAQPRAAAAARPDPAAEDDASSPPLSDEQKRVLQLVVQEGTNVFFTGNAGTGKTFLLNRIIAELRRKYGNMFETKVVIVASTGIAATHIHGTTLYSALGIGGVNFYKDFGTMMKADNRARIRGWEVMVVDEVSMVSAEFLEHMEKQLQLVRGGAPRPAGGLKLVLAGDFFQLPPVTKRFVGGTSADAFMNWGMAFQSPAWQRLNMRQVLLTKVFRQADGEFVRLLDDIRYSRNIPATLSRLVANCSRTIVDTTGSGIRPTKLFSRNKDVDQVNAQELGNLQGDMIQLVAEDSVEPDRNLAPNEISNATAKLERSEFFRDCMAQGSIGLKVGAQVMLLRNLDLNGGPGNSRQLVNGSRGIVTGFQKRTEVSVQLRSELKALGGMVPNPAGSLITSLRARDEWKAAGKDVRAIEVARRIESLDKWHGPQVPIVMFRNGVEMEMVPFAFKSTINNTGDCIRIQVPLKLAYALTIHKCQGLTLDMVQVSLRCMFEKGQAYVALSRARSMEGLQILDWDNDCVKTDPAVRAFYAALQQGNPYSDNAWEQYMTMRRNGAGAAAPQQPYGTQMLGGARFGPPGAAAAGGGGRSKTADKCYKCQGTGHWASQCPGKR